MASHPHDLDTDFKTRQPYRVFLLRCWGERMDGETAWCFTLVQMGGSREQRGFATLESMMAYIDQILLETNHITPEGDQT